MWDSSYIFVFIYVSIFYIYMCNIYATGICIYIYRYMAVGHSTLTSEGGVSLTGPNLSIYIHRCIYVYIYMYTHVYIYM